MRTMSWLVLALAAGCARDSKPSARPDPEQVPQLASDLATQPPPHEAAAGKPSTFVDPGAADPQPVREAIAIVEPLGGSGVRGTVRLRETSGGLDVFAAIEGLSPGRHAYHVHVFGDCSSPDGKSAGPHFHFHGSSLDEHVEIITGNLGELVGTPDAIATHRTTIAATLHGPFALVGRSIVVHEKGNDPAVTPDGGAGTRLACGVIGIAGTGRLEARATASTRQ